MRLLERNNCGEFSLTKDLFGDDISEYAILSHRWGADTEEVTYRDLVDGTGNTNSMENFTAWIRSNSLVAAGSFGNSRAFIPYEQLQQFFKPTSTVDKLKNILSMCGTPADIDVETIRKSFIKVFSILLLINKASYIQDFILRENLSDSSLPFRLGNELVLEDKDGNSFHDEFFRAQWKLCAPVFHLHMDTRFDEQLILPFTKKEKVHDGGTAVVYKVEVHPDYNAFKHREEKQPTKNLFVLKTYSQGIESKRMYDSEVEAFRKLSKSATSGSTIGYYGTYIQGDTYSIILEYADKGDLESFFQHEHPPSTAPDIFEFWKGMFSIVNALKGIHNLDSGGLDTRPPHVLSGWHQDIKPSNILIVSNHRNHEFPHTFKLADFGLSHFKVKDDHDDTPITQWNVGTGTYGAPECRPDSSLSEARLRLNQSVDIWSLGCVFSEAATWLARGNRGIEQYRQLRADELKLLGRGDHDCFHDGEKILDSVQEHLKTLRDWSTRTDPLTSHILDVVDSMLLESSKRPDAKAGYEKIRFCGEQARRDGLYNFWVDTCCIDNELAEAINSMFRWYRNATKFYVYLPDVSSPFIRSTETVVQVLKVFKSLPKVPRGGKRTPGLFSLLSLPFILTWVTPATAELSVRDNMVSSLRPRISSTYGDQNYEIQKFLLELMKPWQHESETAISSEALLVACFLCTFLTVLLFTVRYRDKCQKYFLAAGILLSAIVGAACSEGAQDFIFRYLFFGVHFSMILSTFYHIKYSARENSSVKGWPAFQKNSTGREFGHVIEDFGDKKGQSI